MPGQAARGAGGCPDPAYKNHGLRATDADRNTGSSKPRHARLRHAAAPHRAFEARFEAAGCFDDRDCRARHLRAVARPCVALEGMADDAEAGRWRPDRPCHRKAGLIRADLRALGIGEPLASAACAVVAAALPHAWHAGAVFDVLYVREDAMLGGNLLPPDRRASGWGGGAAHRSSIPTGPDAARCGGDTSTPLRTWSSRRARRRAFARGRPLVAASAPAPRPRALPAPAPPP